MIHKKKKKKERVTKMKRLFLVVVAMMSMTFTFAENLESNETAATNAYDMSVNIRKLGEALGLTTDQMEAVENIHHTFCGEMMIAAQAHNEDRKNMVNTAVNKDLRYMRYVLTKEQFHKYNLLLQTTLFNRGIER